MTLAPATLLALFAFGPPPAPSAAARPVPIRVSVLRVCADPNDLPFSSRARNGFENRVARILAADLGARLEMVWVPLRRGLVRNTLGQDRCDALLGVPAGWERVLSTRPYYRSTYVFASRRDRGPAFRSLDDPRLRTARVGVELVGDDGANPPAAHALASRGIVDNVVGFPVFGDAREEVPGGAIVRAVQSGELDVAIVWGPRAGYAARRDPRLLLVPVPPEEAGPLAVAFAMAVGVRRGNVALKDALDGALARRRAEIERVLEAYGVPRAPAGSARPEEARR
jgi:mxaJ protein